MPKVTRTRSTYARRAYGTPYLSRRAARSYRSSSTSSQDSQATTMSLSQGTSEAQISRHSSLLRNPRLTYSFERTAMQRLGYDLRDGFTLSSGATVLGPGIALSFQLGQMKFWGSGGNNSQIAIPNYTEFTNLFDEWKIDYVKIKIMFTNNISNAINNPNPQYSMPPLPTLQLAVDTDDDVPPTSSNDLLQYQNLRTRCFDTNGPEYIQFKPKAQLATEAGNILATGYASNYGGWLNTSSAGTDYMGLKMFLDLGGTTTNAHFGDFVFYVTYGLKFRGVK